jgi:hypothetical protein
VQGLSFTPDGERLISCSYDTTLLVWDMAAVRARQPKPSPLSDATAAAAWNDLASADAPAACRAIDRLIDAPEQAVPLLRTHLKPAAVVEPARIKRLLAGLDSEDFAEREQAGKELEGLGDSAEPALRRFLAGPPSAEARRRAQALLAAISGSITNTALLSSLRAVEVLEHIGTPEALQVLQGLAKGAAEARLTQDAKAALGRRQCRSGEK